jgi:phosphoadenosine phosphosulfate reductase
LPENQNLTNTDKENESMERKLFSATSDLCDLNRQLAGYSLDERLQWGLSTFGDRLVQVTSFGPPGMVIVDHLARLKPGVKVITIDTGFLFAETYTLWERIQQRYPIRLEICHAALSTAEQAFLYGARLWEQDPDQCCNLRKVLPLAGALEGMAAWITGVRRDQSASRASTPLAEWDAQYHLLKLNPLAAWTRNQVWSYIREHNVPYNALHDRGYTSIGCTHCTRLPSNLADERSGRWQGHQKTECGLHRQKIGGGTQLAPAHRERVTV